MLHPLNAVFWGMKPQNNRQSKPKPAVFLMDFAPEMLLFLFKTRKNSSLSLELPEKLAGMQVFVVIFKMCSR